MTSKGRAPILFLDIDGVLNTGKFMWKYHVRNQFDPDAVVALNKILEAIPFQIVVSSTWRHGRTLDQLKELFVLEGVVPERVVDRTPTQRELEALQLYDEEGEKEYRGFEILTWLQAHPEVTDYAVIDDDSDMMGLDLEKFFKTEFEQGLTLELADIIIERYKARG